MTTPLEFQDLVARLAHFYPEAGMRVRPLPSGVCFLWVNLHGREFVLEYDPRRGTGVSENHADTPPFVGHDEAYDQLAEGVARFLEMLAIAAKPQPVSA